MLFRKVFIDVGASYASACKECKQAPGRCVISSVHSLSASYAYGKGRAVLPSTNLVSSLKRLSLSPGRQHDAQEFLTFLLDHLFSEMTPAMSEAFKKNTHVELTQTLHCNHCSYSSVQQVCEAYLELYATVTDMKCRSQTVDVNDLFLKSLDDEIVNDSDAICSRCGKQGYTKRTLPSTTPQYVFVHTTKYDTGIGYPKIQIQNAFLHFGNGVCYRLVGAVIYHTLGLNCGHYTSYFLDNNQNQWFHADDEKVLPAQLSTVLQQDPFLLLYELCEKPVHALSLRQCEQIINSQWLSDEILQCYFKLICEEAKKGDDIKLKSLLLV